MIFYIATVPGRGRRLCTTQAEARTIDQDFVQIDIPTDKPGLRDAIQELLTEIDEKSVSKEPESQEINPEPSEAVSAPKQDVQLSTREQFEEAWNSFPLALQLHYASLAMEEAQTRRVDVILHGWKWAYLGQERAQVHIAEFDNDTEPDGWCVYCRPDPEDPDASWEGIPEEKDFDSYAEALECGNVLARQFNTTLRED